jgi:hypothetical protein
MEAYYEPSILKNIVDCFDLGFSIPRLFTPTPTLLITMIGTGIHLSSHQNPWRN